MNDRLLTRQFLLVLAVALGLFLNYQCLNVLTPYYLALAGGSSVAVGSVTATFMIAATLSSLLVGLLPIKQDFRWPLVVSLLLLCVPAFAFPLIKNVPLFLTASALRGIGFGGAGVLVGTLVATIAPPSKRGLAIGVVGMTTSGCAIVGQSGTLLLAGRIGFTATFLLTATITILTAGVIIPLRKVAPRAPEPAPKLKAYLNSRMMFPALALLPVCMVYGGIISFAPLHLQNGPAEASAIFFLIIATAIPAARLVAGWLVDRLRFEHVFIAGLGLGVGGMLILGSWLTMPSIAASAVLFGACFGALASSTQIEMTRRVSIGMFAVVNGIFSSAWNAGMGLGGISFGIIAAWTSYGTMFQLSSIALVCAGAILLVDQGRVPSVRMRIEPDLGMKAMPPMDEAAPRVAPR